MSLRAFQERKDLLNRIERELRLSGQKLDALWSEARKATGRTKTDLHNQIAPLREKMQKDRKDQEDLKKSALPLD